jgi:RHS repeat-associated protein
MQDTANGSFPTQHNYTLGLGGVLYDALNSTTYTPGISQRVNGVGTFFHTDWLGSTRYLTDSTGNNFPSALRYDALGNRSATGGAYDPTPFQFAGDWGYQSEFATGPEAGTGLQYLQQRYYDPAIGRFVSPDPIAFLGGTDLYTYAENDPVMLVDPNGLKWRELLGGLGLIVGGAAGAAIGEGVGAVPGAAVVGGFGTYVGSRLDGHSVKHAALSAAVAGGLVYVGGRLSEVSVPEAGAAITDSPGALQAGRQALLNALRAMQLQRAVSEGFYYDVLPSSQGPLEVAAEISKEGETLIVRHVMVYPIGPPRLGLGPREALSLLRPALVELGHAIGATRAKVFFSRTGFSGVGARDSMVNVRLQ